MISLTPGTMQLLTDGRLASHLPEFGDHGADLQVAHDVLAYFDALIGGIVDEPMLGLLRDTILKEGSEVRVDDVTAAILLHHELNPAVLAALAYHVSPVNLTDEDGERMGMITTDEARVRLAARGAQWNSWGVLDSLHPLSQTVSANAEGRKLRDVVSHPALDGMDLDALVVDTDEKQTRIVVAGVRWVRGEELAALLPGVYA